MYKIKRAIYCKFGSIIRTQLIVDGAKIIREDITLSTPKDIEPNPEVEDHDWVNTGGNFNLKRTL